MSNQTRCAAYRNRQAATRKAMEEALKPFADCCDEIGDDESDEEWAKFRLLIKHYRAAKQAITQQERK